MKYLKTMVVSILVAVGVTGGLHWAMAAGDMNIFGFRVTRGNPGDNIDPANLAFLRDDAGRNIIIMTMPFGVDVAGNLDRARSDSTLGTLTFQAHDRYYYNGGANVEPYRHFVIEDAVNGDNEIVAAVADARIRVVAIHLQAAGTTTVRFEDGAGGAVISGRTSQVDTTGYVKDFNPAGWFETSVNTALSMELNAGVTVGGDGTYVEIR